MESKYIIILFALLLIYTQVNNNEVGYEMVNVNGKQHKYLVRDLPDKHEAIHILSIIETNLNTLVNKLMHDNECTNNPEMYGYVCAIKNKLPTVEIQETPENSKYTSFSKNKGELLVFCIRSKQTFKIHNVNELLYVAIHEIAHIGCPEVGHTPLFFKINKYLLNKAIQYNIYKFVDYHLYNTEYCGMTLTSSVANQQII